MYPIGASKSSFVFVRFEVKSCEKNTSWVVSSTMAAPISARCLEVSFPFCLSKSRRIHYCTVPSQFFVWENSGLQYECCSWRGWRHIQRDNAYAYRCVVGVRNYARPDRCFELTALLGVAAEMEHVEYPAGLLVIRPMSEYRLKQLPLQASPP